MNNNVLIDKKNFLRHLNNYNNLMVLKQNGIIKF